MKLISKILCLSGYVVSPVSVVYVGRLAQLVERLHYMEEVEGSNPLIAHIRGSLNRSS